jgi:hypothetical protein
MTFSFEFFHQQMGAICRPGQLWKAFKKTANGRNPLSNMIIQVKFDKVFLAPSPPGTPAHVFNAHIYTRLDVAAILQWRTPTPKWVSLLTLRRIWPMLSAPAVGMH